jgi:hypothetical protein
LGAKLNGAIVLVGGAVMEGDVNGHEADGCAECGPALARDGPGVTDADQFLLKKSLGDDLRTEPADSALARCFCAPLVTAKKSVRSMPKKHS